MCTRCDFPALTHLLAGTLCAGQGRATLGAAQHGAVGGAAPQVLTGVQLGKLWAEDINY